MPHISKTKKLMKTKELIETARMYLSRFNPSCSRNKIRLGEFICDKKINLSAMRNELSGKYNFGCIDQVGDLFKMNVYAF